MIQTALKSQFTSKSMVPIKDEYDHFIAVQPDGIIIEVQADDIISQESNFTNIIDPRQHVTHRNPTTNITRTLPRKVEVSC